MDLFTIMKEYQESIGKPNSDTSINLFVSNIRLLRQKMKLEGPMIDLDFLQDYETVFKLFDDSPNTTFRNYLNAIFAALSAIQIYPEILKIYTSKRDDSNDKYREDNEAGFISQHQADNMIGYPQIMEIKENMGKEVKHTMVKTSKHLKNPEEYPISNLDKQKFQMYVLLTILTKFPRRNEVANLVKITTKEYEKLDEETKSKTNYLVTGKTYKFSFNDYKTNRHYKEAVLEISPEDKKIISKWVKLSQDLPLFRTISSGKELSKKGLSTMLSKFFVMTCGKQVSTTLLAKAFMSHHLDPDMAQKLKDMAAARGHSVSTMLNIYIKQK